MSAFIAVPYATKIRCYELFYKGPKITINVLIKVWKDKKYVEIDPNRRRERFVIRLEVPKIRSRLLL